MAGMYAQKIKKIIFDERQMLLAMLVIGVLSIWAVIGVFNATPYGPPFGSDSVTYMTTATNFAEGRGFGYVSSESGFELLTFYTPLFPAILSLFALVGLDSDQQHEAQVSFREEGGALVLFWMVQSEFTGLYGDQADERYSQFIKGLYLIFDSPEGKVYFYEPPTI